MAVRPTEQFLDYVVDFVNRLNLILIYREKRILLVASRRMVTFAGRDDRSLPLDGAGRLRADVVDNAVDLGYFVYDARGDTL